MAIHSPSKAQRGLLFDCPCKSIEFSSICKPRTPASSWFRITTLFSLHAVCKFWDSRRMRRHARCSGNQLKRESKKKDRQEGVNAPLWPPLPYFYSDLVNMTVSEYSLEPCRHQKRCLVTFTKVRSKIRTRRQTKQSLAIAYRS